MTVVSNMKSEKIIKEMNGLYFVGNHQVLEVGNYVIDDELRYSKIFDILKECDIAAIRGNELIAYEYVHKHKLARRKVGVFYGMCSPDIRKLYPVIDYGSDNISQMASYVRTLKRFKHKLDSYIDETHMSRGCCYESLYRLLSNIVYSIDTMNDMIDEYKKALRKEQSNIYNDSCGVVIPYEGISKIVSGIGGLL